ncbi:MAG: glycosyltransferase [Rhizobiaceae bacterium]|nr:MAG: glycosyltransferase [Rhizobiaceae bacterium]
MATRSRIAFYAPLKPPDDPIPSGDREIARLMVAALSAAGHDVELPSRFISYQKRPDGAVFRERRKAGAEEAARLIHAWRESDQRPHLWFTYHPYCKAPDWLGPAVATALSIPYVTAEACRTFQGSHTDWQDGRAAVQRAVKMAAVNFCLKPSDEAYLRSFLPDMRSVVPLRPFIDPHGWTVERPSTGPKAVFTHAGPIIIAVGMMRPGVKIASYRLLAESLFGLQDKSWNLVIVGDGPEQDTIKGMFQFARERVCFTGSLPHSQVLGWMQASDLLAWPGIGEAIGMVYLEAQALGLPIAACDTAGVANVVMNGITGLLAPQADAPAFRETLAALLASENERRRLSAAGPTAITSKHDSMGAAATLGRALDPLLRRGAHLAGKAVPS